MSLLLQRDVTTDTIINVMFHFLTRKLFGCVVSGI
jgi:hypothetical protein